jgi:methylated-DNA-protein-cysteine methyltransferase-like protein
MRTDLNKAASSNSSFPERVYTVVARIPPGRVTTYGLIARALGSPRSARMVGWALRFVSPEDNLPCHRVVNRIGVLSGGWHFGHPDVMRDRLLAESIPFRDDHQVDLSTCLWDPSDDPALDNLWQNERP